MSFWPIKQAYIGPIAGVHASNVHLLDVPSLVIGGPGASGSSWRFTDTGIVADLAITGTTAANAHANADALDVMLTRAKQAKGINGTGVKIILSLQLTDDEWRYLDVTGGEIAPVRSYPDGRNALVTLTLDTLPHARGDQYTAVLDPATTLTNGAITALVEDIPGNTGALGKLAFSDDSTGGVVINGVRIGARSGYGLAAGDVDLIHDLTAAGIGETLTEASAVGGSVVSTVPGSAWATMAEATIPGTAYSIGLYDLYVRMRDETTNITAPLSLTLTTTPYRLLAADTANVANPVVAITGARAGELLTMGVYGAGTITTPAGWALRVSNGLVYLYDKISDGTETSVTLTGMTSGTKRIYIYGWQGLTTSPADKTANNSGTGTSATPGTTGALAQATEVAIILTGSTGTRTPAAGFTELLDNLLHIQYDITAATTALNPATTISASTTWSCVIATYRVELNGAATSSVPNLAAGTYQVKVVPVSAAGGVGEVSTTISHLRFAGSGPLQLLDWDAPLSGSPATYRIYWNRGSGWRYLATTDARTQAVIHTETGATVADPPNTLAGASHLVQALVSSASGVTQDDTSSVVANLANSTNELVYFGLVAVPPVPPLDDGTVEDTLIQIQTRAQMESTAPLVVDALIMFPHGPDDTQVEAHVRTRDLTTACDWLIETRRDGVTTGRLYVATTTTDAGTLACNNAPLRFGPGSAQIVMHAEIAGGVSSTQSALTPTLELTPLWLLPGRRAS